MKTSLLSYLTPSVATLALWVLPTNANSAQALIDQGDTTLDPNTGLEWLDLSFTQGKSYDSILGGEGGFITSMGYRFATRSETTQLFLNVGAINTVTNVPSDPAVGSLALSLLGCTLPMNDYNRSWMIYDPASDPVLPTTYHVPTAVFGEGLFRAGNPARESVFMVPGLYEGRDLAYPHIASALVRAVPEPSVCLLAVGAAFGCYAGRRRPTR